LLGAAILDTVETDQRIKAMQLHLSSWPEIETYLAPLNKFASAEEVE
jgi:hypothetical protein